MGCRLGMGRPGRAVREGWPRVPVVDQLPSAGTDPASLGDLTTDANYVRQVLDTIDEPVVLVGHSYGGMVITEFSRPPEGTAHRLF